MFAGELITTELKKRAEGDTRVAIKMINSELIQNDSNYFVCLIVSFPQESPSIRAEDLEKRFFQEISIMWSCSFHRSVVTLIGFSKSPMSIVTKRYSTDLLSYIMKSQEPLPISLILKLAGSVFFFFFLCQSSPSKDIRCW